MEFPEAKGADLISCGIDIVSNRRIKELHEKYGNRFIKRVFPEGIDYCFNKRKGEIYGCIASRFALKESIIKAFSSMGINVTFRDIEINGGGSNIQVRVKGYERFKLIFSISHERDFSVAFVNVESGESSPQAD